MTRPISSLLTRSKKMRSLFTLLVLSTLFACASAPAGASPSDVSDGEEGEEGCTLAASEEACLAVPDCAWSDQGEGAACSLVGPIDAQPGSGDPGGGGRFLLRDRIARRLPARFSR